MRARLPYLAVVACLCAFALAPLGYPGYTQSQAGFAPVYALYDWEAAGLDLGWNPSGAIANWGPLRGDGPLPYVLAEALRFAGLDGTGAVRLVFAVAVLLGAAGACTLFMRRSSPLAAIAFALVWVYSPMSLGAVYVRGELGAALALGLLPWLALAVLPPRHHAAVEVGVAPRWRSRGRAALAAMAGLAIGLSSLGFAIAALAALAIASRSRRWWLPGIGVVVSGAWAGMQAATTGLLPRLAPSLQLALPYQLVGSTFGYGTDSLPWAAETPAPMGFGLVPLCLLATAIATASPNGGRRWLHPAVVIALLTLLATTAAAALWSGGMFGSLLAGPWQLIALATFLLVAWLAASLGASISHRTEALAAALALIAMVAAIPALGDVPTTATRPSAAPLATFDGGRIVLVAAELHGPLHHGATPRLRLYWQASVPLERDYTVFVHVVDATGAKWGQRDSQPVDSQAPTTTWRPGAIVEDEHPVYIDVSGPTKGYRLLLGLYDLETGQRLLLANGESALELGGD